MLVKYTYPVTGDMFMPEHWPITWDKYRVTWAVKNGKPESVTVAIQTKDLSILPTIKPSKEPGVAAHIHMGLDPYHDEADSILRTACGLLGFFAHAELDFERPAVEWEAETDEERAKMQMFSYKTEPGESRSPLPTSFDLVARCFLAATAASEKEIPLSFMTKGRRDMRAGRYIDAFYNYYFYFETQYAPGLSNPKRVIEKFKKTAEITAAIPEARKLAVPDVSKVKRLKAILTYSNDQLIEHLVNTRGRLHHHALPRKEGRWHPEKHSEFEAEALILSLLAHTVSQSQNLAMLFDEKITEAMIAGAERAGACSVYLVEAKGGGDRLGLNGLPILQMPTPGGVTPSALAALDEEIRKEGSPYDRMAVRSYVVKLEGKSEPLATYQNNTFPPFPGR